MVEFSIQLVRASTVLLELGNVRVLTDPWFGAQLRGLPCLVAPGVSLQELPRIDLVLASHLHPDHFDRRALRTIGHSELVLIGPVGTYQLANGCPRRRLLELAPWETVAIHGLKITATPSEHTWPPPNEINFVVEAPAGTVFFGGDARYSNAFAEIAQRFRVDVALLPVGGTEIFGRRTVMDPEDALRAARLLGPSLVIPIHEGGTWLSVPPLSRHPGRAARLAKIARQENFTVVVLGPGQQVAVERAPAGHLRIRQSETH